MKKRKSHPRLGSRIEDFLHDDGRLEEATAIAIKRVLTEGGAKVDALWKKEAEDRLAAYRRGEIKAVPLQEVLAKYRMA